MDNNGYFNASGNFRIESWFVDTYHEDGENAVYLNGNALIKYSDHRYDPFQTNTIYTANATTYISSGSSITMSSWGNYNGACGFIVYKA